MSDRLLSLLTDSRPSAERAPADTAFRELDRVRILSEVVGEEGVHVPAGSTGTVVAVWGGGAAFDVEFTRPVETLAAVAPEGLVIADRSER